MDDVADRIGVLLDTLESMDEEYAATHAGFAQSLFDDDSPTSFEIAAMYLQWAVAKTDIVKNSFRMKCRCDSGWLEGTDGGIKPCPACRAEANERWFSEFVDSGEPPT